MALPYDPNAAPPPVDPAVTPLPYQPEAVPDNTPVAPTTNTVIRGASSPSGFDWSTARVVGDASPSPAPPVVKQDDGSFVIDSGKTLGGGTLEGLGNATRGVGELFRLGGSVAASAVNSLFGTDKNSPYYLRATNPLASGDGGAPVADKIEGAGKAMLDSRSDDAKQAIADSTPTADLFKGEFDLGKNPTLKGYAYQLENLAGNLAPVLAATVLTGGASLPAQAAVGAVGGGALGAGQAAAQAKEWVESQSHEDLMKHSKVYAALIAEGKSPAAAKEETSQKAQAVAAPFAAAVGMIGGAVVGGTLGKLAHGVDGGLIQRLAVGGAVGATEGSGVGVAQNTATNAGINVGAGADVPLGQGSGSMAVVGALGGGIAGAARARAPAAPLDVPPAAVPPAAPAGPLARAADASSATAARAQGLTAVNGAMSTGPGLLERAAGVHSLDQPQGTTTLLDENGRIIPSDARVAGMPPDESPPAAPAAPAEPAGVAPDPAIAANLSLASKLRANGTKLLAAPSKGDQRRGQELIARAAALEQVAGQATDAHLASDPLQTAADTLQPAALPAPTIDAAAHEAAASPLNDKPLPTPAQSEANNVALGHLSIAGLPISIEHPVGSTKLVGADGPAPFTRQFGSHSGYIKGTVGGDGEHLDVYVKPGTSPDFNGKVFTIDQTKPDGGHDETKSMIGFDSAAAAEAVYRSHFPDGKAPFGGITEQTVPEFKAWVKSGDKTKPIADFDPALPAAQPPKENVNDGITQEAADRPAQRTPEEGPANQHGADALDAQEVREQVAPSFTLDELAQHGYHDLSPDEQRVASHVVAALHDSTRARPASTLDALGFDHEGNERGLESAGAPRDEGVDPGAPEESGAGSGRNAVEASSPGEPAAAGGERAGLRAADDTGGAGEPTGSGGESASDSRSGAKRGLVDVPTDESRSVPVTKIEGTETTGYGDSPIQSAKKYALAKLQGRTFKNDETGWEIGIGRKGIQKTLSHAARPEQGKSIAALPNLLKHATKVRSEENRKADERADIPLVHHFYAPLDIGDRRFLAHLVVKETRDGKKFYDHDLSNEVGPAQSAADAHLAKQGAANGEAGPVMSMRELLGHVNGTGTKNDDPPTAFSREQSPPSSDVNASNVGLDYAAAVDLVDRITSSWMDKPDTVVVASYDDLPAAVRADHAGQGGQPGEVQGAFHGGKLYLVADAHDTPAELETTLFHEAWGHFGLRSAFGESMSKTMANIFDRVGGMKELLAMANRMGIGDQLRGVRDAVLEAQQQDPRYSDDLIKRTMVEELVAYATEKGMPGINGRIKEFIGAVRNWLRKNGFATLAKFNDLDLAHVIATARDAVRLGEKSDVFVQDATAFKARGIRDTDRILADAINNGDPGTYFRRPGKKTAPQSPQEKNMPKWVRDLPKDKQDALRKSGVWVEKQSLKERWDSMRQEAGLKIVQGAVDQYRPILARIGEYPYKLLRMAGSSGGALESSMRNGHIKLNDAGALEIKENTKGLLDTLKPLGDETDRFLAWIAGNRAERLMAEGREHNFTAQDIAFLKDLRNDQSANDQWTGKGTRADAYNQALRDWNAYSKSIYDIAEKSGIVSTSARAAWENEFYVPFYRESEDKAPIPGNISGMVNQKGVKRLKGGVEDLHDLLANSLGNWGHLLDSSLRNNAARETLVQAERLGIARPLTAKEKGSVYFLHDGQPRHYMVTDPLVMDAIGSLATTPFKGPVMKALGAFKHALTVGTTMSPVFRIRHTIREQITAMAANPTSYNFVKNWIDGFQYSSKSNPVYGQMEAGGAFMRMGQSLDGDRGAYMKRMIAENVDKASILNNPTNIKAAFKHLNDWWKETGERSDSITRANLYRQEYARRIAAGETADKAHFEAAYVARDVMDFGLHGTSAGIRLLTQVVPFMNARMQGMYKLGRGAAEDPKRFSAVIGGVTLATIALGLLNQNDKEIMALPDSDHENNWIFRIPGTDKIFRIPKPFEVGALATVVDRALQVALNGFQPADRDAFMHRLGPIIGGQLAMNPIPQAVWPAVQLWANKDEFRGSPIESQRDAKLTSDQRIGTHTSAVAQLAGKGMAAVLPQGASLSPEQIDFLVNSYLGWVGTHAVATADLALRPAMGLPSKAAARIDDYFLVGDFVHQLPSDQSHFVNDFYDHMAKVQQQMGDVRQFQQLGQGDKAKEYFADHKDTAGLDGTYTATSKAIGQLNLLDRRTLANDKLTPDQKRAQLDSDAQRKNALAKQAEDARAARMNR